MLELLAVFIVAILAFGPRQFPQLARQLGRFFAKIKLFYQQYQREFERSIKQAELESNIARAEQAEEKTALEEENEITSGVIPRSKATKDLQEILRRPKSRPAQADNISLKSRQPTHVY